MRKIYKLQGGMQYYAWGGEHYLPELLKQPYQQGQHYAEWWLGTHNAMPSTILMHNSSVPLATFIAENPQILGEKSRILFGDTLPFLLKILDVAKPLSIQLHPNKAQAEQGFLLENQQGIDLDDPYRTYKDNNHKPEMMLALSDFWLLHGFRHKQDIIRLLSRYPSLTPLAERLKKHKLHQVYAEIMQADQSQLATWLMPIVQANYRTFLKNRLNLDNPDYWVLYTMQAMNITENKLDSGLLCFYFLNLVHLQKGEAIFQAAGIPHAYLRGQNIELMATSDNVIRGGLTSKYVNISALLEIMDTREITPNILPKSKSSYHTFSHFVEDFALCELTFEQNTVFECHSRSAEIILAIEGALQLNHVKENQYLQQGEAAFVSADCDYSVQGIKKGQAVIAKLP